MRLLGQPEIQDLHLAPARDHDVVRLQIPMHQTCRMRRRQAGGHLRGDVDRLRRGNGPRSIMRRSVSPLDQFGGNPVRAIVAADLVDGDDVGVIECASRAGFALETGDTVRVAGKPRAAP